MPSRPSRGVDFQAFAGDAPRHVSDPDHLGRNTPTPIKLFDDLASAWDDAIRRISAAKDPSAPLDPKAMGNAFDKLRRKHYETLGGASEVRLNHEKGPRIDSYRPDVEIVERKHWKNLADAPSPTSDPANRLAELIKFKNKADTGIVYDTADTREKISDAIGKRLSGELVLEVPMQKPHPGEIGPLLLEKLQEYQITVRDVAGRVVFKPEPESPLNP